MNPSEYILNLVGTVLADSNLSISDLVRQAARIARLRNDYQNLLWLEWETINICDNEQKSEVLREVSRHFTDEQLKNYYQTFAEAWMNERKFSVIKYDLTIDPEKMITPESVKEIENSLEQSRFLAQEAVSPQGLHHQDLHEAERSNQILRTIGHHREKNYEDILGRIKNRTLKYLSNVETQLIYGQLHSDIFEENRLYVDKALNELSPEALRQFVASYQRMKEDNPESWAQALTSARRLLKSLADIIYPPSNEPVKGSDGKERVLKDEMYIARLWQYVFEKIGDSTSGALFQTQVEDYGKRIDRLYELACKGVHADVSKLEVNQCVIQTYILIGDLLRLRDNTSAVTSVDLDNS